MARIRTIKPEFPQSESMGRVSRDARLTFIQAWTIADDEGRLRGNSRMLASLLFPYDDDAPSLMDGWLVELEREGCLVRYSSDGQSYIQICNWMNHQKIDKPSKSKFPAFNESSRIVAKPRECSSEDQGSRIKDQGRDHGEEASSKPTPTKRATSLPADFYPNEVGVTYAEQRRIDLAVELESFRNWHSAKGSTFKDWQAAWRTWCDKASQFGRARASPATNRADERARVGDVLTGRAGNERSGNNERDITGESYRVA